jgi:Nif-specific regulatory protein
MTEIKKLKEEIKLLNSRIDDFERLFKILKSVSSSLQIEKILELILSEAVSLCRANHGSIVLFDPDKNQITKTLIRSEDSKRVKIDNYLNNLLAGWVYDNLKILLTHNLIDTFNAKLIKEKYRDITSVLSVPITEKQKILGVINLVSLNDEYRFGVREIQLIENLAIQCVNIIVNAKLHESLFQETNRLRKELNKKYTFREVIGNSPKLREVFSLLERIIPTDARVMIEGESGTGKELIARILHYNGPHKNGPFVGVDCGAFPENLLESELFGYVKGAFTGATKDKAGLYEEAQNGTLFLDEITNMPINIQSKLLRVLQEGEIRPVGSTKTKKLKVRVISAASESLKESLKKGKFREDLYYRLSVVNVNLPPLRERYGDILLLINYFIKKYSEKYQKPVTGLKSETFQLMESYSWPGNIRELENVIERLVILVEPGVDYIPPELLPEDILSNAGGIFSRQNRPITSKTLSIKEKKADYEKDMLMKALIKNNWNQSIAAEELGLHESTLRYKMRRLGIKKR